MMIDTVSFWAVGLLIAALLIIGGALIIRAISRIKNPTPGLESVLKALDAEAHLAVIAGIRMAVASLQSVNQVLTDQDIINVAKAWYARIPDTVIVDGVSLPVRVIKVIVTQTVWNELVTALFNKADATILANIEWLTKQLPSVPPPGSISPPFRFTGFFPQTNLTNTYPQSEVKTAEPLSLPQVG